MSMMFCCTCDKLCNTDDDPEGFYVPGYEDKFVCEFCRDRIIEDEHEEPANG